MIIRALHLGRGRIALPRTLTPVGVQRRQQSSLETSRSHRVDAPAFVDNATSVTQRRPDFKSSDRAVKLNDPNHPVALDYAFHQHQKARTQHLGAAVAPHYKPQNLVHHPPSPKDITLELLLASQAHIGHATSLWHPANARYIFGVRGRKKVGESPIHIISLEATAAHLRRACKVVQGVTERGGLVLFVGTREGQARSVVKAAQLAQGCHLYTNWIPGAITNGQQILGRCAKKVVNELDQEVPGFEDQLVKHAVLKPDLVVCLNPLENNVLLHECGLNNIPTIGIIDTDANPTWVTYPIPANDDSLRSVQVIVGALGRAGEEGQAHRRRLAADGFSLHSPTHSLTAPTGHHAASSDNSTSTRLTPRNQRSAPASTASAEPVFPDDFEGVDVKQYEEDQKLISQAEEAFDKQFGASSTLSSTTASSSNTNMETGAASAEEPDNIDLHDATDLDPSLTDDAYTGVTAESFSADDDLDQFGGAEQLKQAKETGVQQELDKDEQPGPKTS